MNKDMNKELQKIAKTILDLETLQARNADSLDFKEQAVWNIKEALEQAYKAGQQSVKK